MAKLDFDIRPYAMAGARHRLEELDREREAILNAFPDLGISGGGATRRSRSRSDEANLESLRAENAGKRGRPRKSARKRGQLSDEGRRRIAEAQRARWAAKRAKTSPAEKRPRGRAASQSPAAESATRERPRMTAAARKAVSVRMKKYWAARRRGQG